MGVVKMVPWLWSTELDLEVWCMALVEQLPLTLGALALTACVGALHIQPVS